MFKFKEVVILLLCLTMLSSLFVMSCDSGNTPPSGDTNENENYVYAPTEHYVIQCLQKVPGVIEIMAATEDNDPNGQLNKPKGYTAHVYFSYVLVNQDDIIGDDLIEKGTDAGGSIEVYSTKEDAIRRNAYLSELDGGIFTSGSHIVVGTVVVRTSHELTATRQELLENNIIAALCGEDHKISSIPDLPDNPISPQPEKNSKEDAIKYVQDFAQAYEEEHPDDYITPAYVMGCLDIEGYSEEIALYAIEHANVNWEHHATNYIQVYLVYEAEFGSAAVWIAAWELEDMLYEEQFSYNVVSAVINKVDWDKQLVAYIQHLSDFYDTLYRDWLENCLYDILADEEGIAYAIENSGVDWSKHALNIANEAWIEYKFMADREENGGIAGVLEQIENELLNAYDFTESEVAYAMEHINLV